MRFTFFSILLLTSGSRGTILADIPHLYFEGTVPSSLFHFTPKLLTLPLCVRTWSFICYDSRRPPPPSSPRKLSCSWVFSQISCGRRLDFFRRTPAALPVKHLMQNSWNGVNQLNTNMETRPWSLSDCWCIWPKLLCICWSAETTWDSLQQVQIILNLYKHHTPVCLLPPKPHLFRSSANHHICVVLNRHEIKSTFLFTWLWVMLQSKTALRETRSLLSEMHVTRPQLFCQHVSTNSLNREALSRLCFQVGLCSPSLLCVNNLLFSHKVQWKYSKILL